MPLTLLPAFLSSFWPIYSLCLVIAALCGFELAGLAKVNPLLALPGLAYVALAPLFATNMPYLDAVAFLVGINALFMGWKSENKLAHSATVFFGALWFAAPLVSLTELHSIGARSTSEGFVWMTPLLLALLPIWAGDTAAIFVGRAWGKRPLAPSISPKKTIEGSIGNLLACCVMGILLVPLLHVEWSVGLGAGLICGVFGQLGDLFESWLKRLVGAKDSGSLLPGHGGFLDRIDSILFSAIPLTLLIEFFASSK